jgi:hemoglobin/transferrin/lactoferrin receptor protein
MNAYKNNILTVAIAAATCYNPAAYSAEDRSIKQPYKMKKVVVTATRSEQALEDTAASVAVIEAGELEAGLSNTIEKSFDYTPGVTVDSDSRFGVQDINIRGMEGNRIKVTVDGVKQPQRFDSGAEFVQSGRLDIDPDMIKRIEVIKGPSSSLHGSDAIGGLVAFETKDPDDFLNESGDDTGGWAKLGYYSADASFAQTIALANRSGNLASMIIYNHRNGDEVKNFGASDPQDTNKDNILAKLQYQFNAHHRLELTGESVNTDVDTELPLVGRGRRGPTNYDYYYAEDEKTRQRLGLTHIWQQQTTLFNQLRWSLDWQKKSENDDTLRRATGAMGETKDYSYEEQGYQFELQLNKDFNIGSSQHQLIYGASFNNRDIANINMTLRDDGSSTLYHYMPEASETQWGVYIQDEISLLAGRLLITPGLRFDSFSTEPDNATPTNNSGDISGYEPTDYQDYSDNAVTGRLGAVFAINEQHKIFAQYSQGFRAPDFKELFYSFSNSRYYYKSEPNPDLEAETSNAYELGLRSNFNIGNSEIALFYSDYDDFIDTVNYIDNTGMSVTTYQNLEEATVKGIEFSANLWLEPMLKAPEGSYMRVSAAYTDGEDKAGDPLNSVAPWDAVIGLGYDNPEGHWGAEIKTVYTASKDDSDINMQSQPDQLSTDSSTVIDLTAYYRPLDNLTLRAGVFNATDAEYVRWSDARGKTDSDLRPIADYTQPQRNYSVSMAYDF